MLLRFRSENYSADFELYGAQAESVLGVYDALRSAIIDVTADAVVLRDSSEVCIAALEEQEDGVKLKALAEQVAMSRAFAEQPTEVYMIERSEGRGPEVPFFSFPGGLGTVADQLLADLATLARALNGNFGFKPAALAVLTGLDGAYDASVLPTPIEKAKSRSRR